jgi:hypothetical protein
MTNKEVENNENEDKEEYVDDMIYVEQMGKAYELIDAAYKNADNKSQNMIMFIGTMFTLQSTLLLPIISTITGLITCILGLICYFISIIIFIVIITLKKYSSYPNAEQIINGYEMKLSYEDYVKNSIGYYRSAIIHNQKILDSKSEKTRYAFLFLIEGIVFTLVSIIVNVWML